MAQSSLNGIRLSDAVMRVAILIGPRHFYTADTGVWSSANEPGVKHSTVQTVIGVPRVTALQLGVVYQSFMVDGLCW